MPTNPEMLVCVPAAFADDGRAPGAHRLRRRESRRALGNEDANVSVHSRRFARCSVAVSLIAVLVGCSGTTPPVIDIPSTTAAAPAAPTSTLTSTATTTTSTAPSPVCPPSSGRSSSSTTDALFEGVLDPGTPLAELKSALTDAADSGNAQATTLLSAISRLPAPVPRTGLEALGRTRFSGAPVDALARSLDAATKSEGCGSSGVRHRRV